MKILNMRNAIFMLALGALSMNSSAQKINTPAPSPLQTLTQAFGLGEVTVEYSRPVAKGRTIFGEVVPMDKIWRTGANGATKITFTDVVSFEGKEVKPGTYSIYTIPHEGSCEVMLYSDLTLGGSVADYDEKNEVLRVKVASNKIPIRLESFTILIDEVLPTSANLILAWENTSIIVKLSTDIDTRVSKSIEESMKSKTPEYYKAAAYYFDNGKDLKQALTWIDKAIESSPKAFWMTLLKARIEYGLGDTKAGKATAEKTIKMAEEAKNGDYVRMAKELMAKGK